MLLRKIVASVIVIGALGAVGAGTASADTTNRWGQTVNTNPFTGKPVKTNPFTGQPVRINPFTHKPTRHVDRWGHHINVFTGKPV